MTDFHFYGGAALSSTRFVTIAYDFDRDRPSEPFPLTRIQVLDAVTGGWMAPVERNWRAESVAATTTEYAVLSVDGDVYVMSTATAVAADEAVSTEPTLGMYGLGYVNKVLYAVGAGGHVYSRRANGVWDRHETQQFYSASELAREEEETRNLSFGDPTLMARLDAQVARLRPWYCVADDNNGGFWVGGQGGRLVHFLNGEQQNLSLPTSANFSEVVSGLDGQMLAVAHTPQAEIWRISQDPKAQLTFSAPRNQHAPYRTAVLGGVLYFGDPESLTGGLFQLDGETALRVTIPNSLPPAPVCQVRAVEKVLWVVTANCLWRMSDGNWERFEKPPP
jgi:hypothetical protein